MSLTSKQRAALRGMANTMEPVFQIGKGEIDETLIKGVDDCIKFAAADISAMRTKSLSGVMVTNPPYGERIGDRHPVRSHPCRVRAGDWPQVCAVPQKAEGICLCGTAEKVR